MGIVRTLAAVAILNLGSGCVGHKLFEQPVSFGEGLPSAPLSTSLGGSGVVQASATTPANSTTTSTSFSKPNAKGEKKNPATELTILWRNKIDFLPDPSRNGQMGAGLAGQVFMFGADMKFAPAEGKLIVALYDETPRAPGVQPNKPEGWEFTKETLRGLRTPDERFGPSYAVFLPWPTYRPDITRIRIAARFEPEQGHPLYAQETMVTLDNIGMASKGNWSNQQIVPGSAQPQPAGGFNALGGPAPATGSGPGLGMIPSVAPTSPMGTLQPASPNFGRVEPVAPIAPATPQPVPMQPVGPGNLPPIAIIAPRPQ